MGGGVAASCGPGHFGRGGVPGVAGGEVGVPAVLLILTGVAVFFEELPLPGASGALLFTIALATGAMTGALAGSAALALPGLVVSCLTRS